MKIFFKKCKRFYRRFKMHLWFIYARIIYHWRWSELVDTGNYNVIIGNASEDEIKKRKKLMIISIGILMAKNDELDGYDFDYKEEKDMYAMFVDLFDGNRFTAKRSSDKIDKRQEICNFQTLLILVMSGNFPSDQNIVIFVEHYDSSSITYRILYKLDLGGSVDEDIPLLDDSYDVPTSSLVTC